MRKGTRYALLAVAALAAVGSASAVRGPQQQNVAGAGATEVARFSLNAFAAPGLEKQPVGGQAVVKWTARPRGSLEMRVTCLNVAGNTAVLGGQIKKTAGPRLTPGRWRAALFTVQDNASTGEADRFSKVRLLKALPLTCPAPNPLGLRYAIREGNIVIRNTAPRQAR